MSTQLSLRDDVGNSLAQRAHTPMDLLQAVMSQLDKDGAVEAIKQLAPLLLQFEERNDKIAFSEAMARFRDEMPKIVRSRSIRGKKDAQGNEGPELYKAVALEDVADPFMKALAQQGIMYRWTSIDLPDGRHRVTCFLRLKGTAYEEQGASIAAPPDTSGGKDTLKAIGSSISYLEKYTLLESCGAHVYGSDPEAEQPEGVTNDEGSAWVDKIGLCDTAPETMRVWTQAIEAAKKFKPIDYKAMTIFTEARDKRLLQIRGAR